jgi:hypothetical protein
VLNEKGNDDGSIFSCDWTTLAFRSFVLAKNLSPVRAAGAGIAARANGRMLSAEVACAARVACKGRRGVRARAYLDRKTQGAASCFILHKKGFAKVSIVVDLDFVEVAVKVGDDKPRVVGCDDKGSQELVELGERQ